MNILEVYDYSWNPIPENLKKQARICVGLKLKPILMDINTMVGVGPTVSSLDAVGIPRSELLDSSYTPSSSRGGRSSNNSQSLDRLRSSFTMHVVAYSATALPWI
jgi:hypothetical protein